MKYCDACKTSYPDDFKVCPRDQSVLRTTTELTQGTVLRNKYEILAKIGVGGMATVYKAKHLTFNELRALKIVSSKLSDDPLFLKRFKTEAIVTRKLKHHNAVRVEDFDETEDGRPYIVMEYVEGKNLRSVVHELKRLPLERALEIARQTAAALSAAHQLGITHRDIKPDNILLVQLPDGSEQVKVLDFGIAKLKEGSVEHTSSYTPTQTGMVMGTPQYISPEQALGRSGEEIDGRADLYSLGVVLYEMLCGELPFRSDTPIGLLMHHISTAPTPPHTLNPELPPAISQMLLKCLEKDRDKRYKSADEFLEALSRPELTATTEAYGSNTMAASQGAPASTPPPLKTPLATAPLTPPRLSQVAPASAAAAAKPAAVATPPGVPTPATAPLPQPAAQITPVMTTPVAPPAPRIAQQRVNVPTIVHAPAPRSHGLLYAALGAAIVLLLGAGYLLMRQQQPAPQPTPAATAAVDPAKVVSQIQLLYNSSPVLQKHGIVVAFANGVATLNGSVDNQSESELATALASNVAGVSNVNNQLTIQPGAESSEHEAAAKAEKAAAEQQRHAEAKPAASQPVEQQPAPQPAPSNASTQPASADQGDTTDLTQGSGWSKDQRVQALVDQGYRDMEARKGRKAYFEFQKALELDPGNKQAQAGIQRLEQWRRQQQQQKQFGGGPPQ